MKSALIFLIALIAIASSGQSFTRTTAFRGSANKALVAGGSGGGWSNIFTNYAGLKILLDADLESYNDGDLVSTAYDKGSPISLGTNLTAATTARPTFKKNILGGTNSAFCFDGTSDELKTVSIPGTAFFGAESNTVFAVVAITNLGYAQLFNSVNTTISFFAPASGQFFYDDPLTSARLNGATPAYWTNRWCVLELYRDGANSKIIYNGVDVATKANCSGVITGSDVFYVGSGGGGGFSQCAIGKFAIYDRHIGDTARGAIRTNLYQAYGITPP